MAKRGDMHSTKETITVRANIEVTPAALQAVVENAKTIAGRDEKGRFRVDTADRLSEMISLFLEKYDFESFAKNIENYYRVNYEVNPDLLQENR